MSKKLILFLMVLLLGSTSFLRAEELTVHDGTGTNSYVPVYGFYADAFLKCEMVFPAAELADMENGTISGITFYASTPAAEAWTGTFQVFVAEVADATISAFAGPGTVVYEGTLDGTQSSMAITFNAPYAYNGGNLLVGVYCTEKGNYKSVTWAGEAVDGASVQGYNYNDITAITATQRNFLPKTTFAYTPGSGPTPPPTPTGNFAIIPNDEFALGERPVNGWMEPFTVTLQNNTDDVTVSASMSNTSGQEPFIMSEEINDLPIAAGERYEFDVEWNANAADGEYAEEFTLFYAETRNIVTVPVTATLYTAGWADIVEKAEPLYLSYTAGVAEFNETPANLHANYNLPGMDGMSPDAVYSFTLNKDAKFSVTAGTFIGIYNRETGVDFHPTTEVEPLVQTLNGEIVEEVLLAGQYYMIVAGDNITTVEGTVEQIPAPAEITNLAPADGTTDVGNTVTLTWEGGENATQYQVLFGTSPTNMPVALDWTRVEEGFGSYTATGLVANTQYFWQIKAKNSNGTVTGPRWGFTTALIAPNQVTATETEIFTDGNTLIKWRLAGTGGFTGEITVADGTTTNSYLPVYGLWCDYYTRGEMIYPAEMLEEMTGGDITSLEFYLSSPATASWSPDVFQVYFQEVDATTMTAYYTAANAQICYTGALDGTGTTMVINLDEPYHYNGGNLLLGIQETVNGTYKSASFYGISATGASASGYNSSSLSAVTFNQRNFLPKVKFTCGGREVAENRTHQGFNVYYGDVKANTELITENKYLLGNLPYNVNPGHNVTVTAVYDEGESELSDPVVVKVSGYGKFTGTVTELISGAPIAGVEVKFNGQDEFGNNVMFEGTTNNNGVYTINNVKAGSYTGTARLEGMEPKMSDPVTLAYAATETVNFVMHEVYNPVMSVTAEEMDSEMSRVKWSMTEILPVPAYPVPGGNTPGGGGGGGSTPVADQTFTFDASTMEGWTTLDANNDGYDWVLGSNIGGIYLVSGASLAGSGHNSSNDMVCSGSYSNATSSAITPDNYLVSPTKAAWTSVSFFACGQDASYVAEHFGVAVSTTGNTSAADFTTVQEWTMTAKGEGAMSIGRNGETRAQGSWHEYTVDLSAYAGQDIWVAIRHFNCNDMFILDVDDITLHGSAKGGRDVQEYALYRAAILTENGEPVYVDSIEDVTPYYITTVTGATQYADFEWNDMEPGLYQYGVSAIYPSPAKAGDITRDEVIIGEGTATNSYVPTYNLYNYSCTNQIYTGDEIGGAGTINSIAFMPATVNTPTRNLKVYMVNTEKTSFSGATDWVPVTDADLVFDGTANWTANTWCTLTLDTPFQFDGTNLCVVVNDLTGSWTSSNQYFVSDATAQAIRIYQDSAPYNPAAPGNGTVLNVKNNIKLDITFGGGGNDNPVTPVVWSNVLPKDIWATVTVNAIVPVGTPEGTQVRFHNTFENTNDLVVVLNETGCDTIWPFRKGEYTVSVDLEGWVSNYANTPVSIWGDTEINVTFEEIFKPVENVTATRMGYASWDEVVPAPDRFAERYMITLNDVEYAQQVENFIQIAEEDLTVGETYTVGVAVVYSTGMSAFKEATFTYTDCNGATYQVTDLVADNTPGNTNVTLAWDGETPNPNPNPNPNPGTGASYNFDDNTMMGWTSIDGDGDGNGWVSSANPGIYHNSGVNLAGTGHNSSQAYVISGSYANQTGQALTPNNFLVSPASGPYTNISFWACAQDASYAAEHFGVAVSTTGNTSASAFTTVQEWTMTAKGEGAMSAGRTRQTRQGTWYNYTVDLSAYAGQNIWVAIRHFNCTDMFILNVDDIELTTPAKALEAGILANAGTGYGAINYDRDGNWYYYDNGTNYDAIGLTSGGGFYWGIMFPAGTIDGNRLTKVSYFDPTPSAGTVTIYQGGTSAPGSQLYSQPYTTTGSEQVIEIEMGEPVEIDAEQNIWVVMHNTSGQYVASYDGAAPGQTYGSLLSTDGSTWYESLYSATGGSYGGNWNIRAYVEAGAGPAPSGLVPNKYNIFFDGELVGATASRTFTYDAGDFAEHEYVVVWVDSDYLESCIVEGENMINYSAQMDAIEENSVINAIYPNPTSGDLHINAVAMRHISIYNALGQMVYDQEVNADEIMINMAQYESGVYMVNVITENGTSVKRITVTK